MTSVLVTGAGGFIGGHLVARLRDLGVDHIRGVDRVPFDEWHQRFGDVDNRSGDLQDLAQCQSACEGIDVVYNLAADMGGMGFIENNKALCMLSVLISTHMLEAARHAGVQRFFYSSSACVYAAGKQESTRSESRCARPTPTRPCPRTATAGRSCSASACAATTTRTSGSRPGSPATTTSTARTGPTTADGRRRPRPSAARSPQAVLSGTNEIEIWGDGKQTRSFTYIDDCVTGTLKLTSSDVREPLNIGSEQLVTINELVDIVEGIAGVTLKRNYNLTAPQGVRGRNSDNTLIRERLGWAPSISLEEGLQNTYKWIFDQMSEGAAPIIR